MVSVWDDAAMPEFLQGSCGQYVEITKSIDGYRKACSSWLVYFLQLPLPPHPGNNVQSAQSKVFGTLTSTCDGTRDASVAAAMPSWSALYICVIRIPYFLYNNLSSKLDPAALYTALPLWPKP